MMAQTTTLMPQTSLMLMTSLAKLPLKMAKQSEKVKRDLNGIRMQPKGSNRNHRMKKCHPMGTILIVQMMRLAGILMPLQS